MGPPSNMLSVVAQNVMQCMIIGYKESAHAQMSGYVPSKAEHLEISQGWSWTLTTGNEDIFTYLKKKKLLQIKPIITISMAKTIKTQVPA